MYNVNLKYELACQTHPGFNPAEESAPKRCRSCAVIVSIYEWSRLIDRSARKLQGGAYAGMLEPEAPEPVAEVEVLVAPPPPATAEAPTESKKKRATGGHVKHAPEKL